MNTVIGEAQSAFLGGRNILDGVLIAKEVMDWWKSKSKRGLLIKIDFEKAYDSINWKFLLKMMKFLGFGNKWIKWMDECITTARSSVLINGSPTEEFKLEKEVRQGDPLSPFLFLMVAEALNRLMDRAKELGLIKGASVGQSNFSISYLQFADDTILFCEVDVTEVTNIKRILRCFEVMSGMKVNFHKSGICGVGIENEILDRCAGILRCKKQRLPMKYLGLPLGVSPRRQAMWKLVIELIKKRLSSWKKRFLSFGGRLVLIKSVISSLPVYYMSLFKMPERVAKCIERIQATFLWGGDDANRKIHLISWDKIIRGKDRGGLDVRNIKIMNECLLCKWHWRFGAKYGALWKKLICSKYDMELSEWSSIEISDAAFVKVRLSQLIMCFCIVMCWNFLINMDARVQEGLSHKRDTAFRILGMLLVLNLG
ncbi:hypothetical protein Acr_00g0020140 [Actinidia rufa]|uniref:Reverse transcriptase domain-containing protein n=1 Tax=Actinidia rufa TaxID=165716 RepID=A0A7J0DBY4_9ERIC|nr:hypothetical protein Acr_00g0020140 [Actinidia rufa]